MSEPKRHHYVPCMLLKHFTVEGTRKGTLYPFEPHGRDGIRWKRRTNQEASPDRVAFLKFFYSVPNASVGGEPQIVEELIGRKFENKWDEVLGTVVTTSKLPSSHDLLTDLIQFVAFSAIRTPRFKEIVCDLFKHIGKTGKQLEECKRFLVDYNQSGSDQIGDAFEGLVEKSKKGFDQDDWVRAMIVYSPIALGPFLFRQNWTIYDTGDTEVHFVCTDDPVTIFDNKGMIYDVSHVSDPEKLIMMPLSPKHLLLSEPIHSSETLTQEVIAKINTMQLSHSTTGFAIEPRFCHMSENTVVWNVRS